MPDQEEITDAEKDIFLKMFMLVKESEIGNDELLKNWDKYWSEAKKEFERYQIDAMKP